MEYETRMYAFITVVVVLIFFALWWYLNSFRKDQKLIAERKQAYDQAIQEGKKRLALQIGREYYAALRGGRLTIFDELAIANDLSTIASKSGSSTQQ